MTPAAWITVLAGLGLLAGYAWELYGRAGWLHAKLTLVAALVIYHWLCGRYRVALRDGHNRRSARFFRVFNEIPTLILIAVVCVWVAVMAAYTGWASRTKQFACQKAGGLLSHVSHPVCRAGATPR